MHQTKLVGVFVLFLTAVGVRCSWQPFDDYETDDYSDGPAWHCDTETKNALAEVKSEIQALQELLVGLRQKLDPDFRSPTSTTPRKFVPLTLCHIICRLKVMLDGAFLQFYFFGQVISCF